MPLERTGPRSLRNQDNLASKGRTGSLLLRRKEATTERKLSQVENTRRWYGEDMLRIGERLAWKLRGEERSLR